MSAVIVLDDAVLVRRQARGEFVALAELEPTPVDPAAVRALRESESTDALSGSHDRRWRLVDDEQLTCEDQRALRSPRRALRDSVDRASAKTSGEHLGSPWRGGEAAP
jgi:hypothetical protein